MDKLQLLNDLAAEHGTPLIVVDHEALRRNYQTFRQLLPRVQIYYAVKANPDPAILETFYHLGASFDVASLSEFHLVHKNIEKLPDADRQQFIWGKIIYANPIKAIATLKELDRYKPLVTYDNPEEVQKVRQHAPHAGLVLRVKVPNTGAVVELSSKFGAPPGEAVRLIRLAEKSGLAVEGISFHVGSQNTNYANYINALHLAEGIFREARLHGFERLKILDIGGGFPAPYDPSVRPFAELATMLNAEFERLFPQNVDLAAEPGRYLVATAATLIASVIGKTKRGEKPSYYLDDGVYQTFSGIIFDRCKYRINTFKKGHAQISAVYGPTCDSLDTISLSEELPELNIGDLVYAENIGAYSYATATHFNGFSPAKIVHINR
ncbi:MAG: type III PLP-dependent enzyme [Spirochaetaceae bacterium]|nr:MAG: type III PLP-dependent enzyme [Spirochaetaceae bacterium]